MSYIFLQIIINNTSPDNIPVGITYSTLEYTNITWEEYHTYEHEKVGWNKILDIERDEQNMSRYKVDGFKIFKLKHFLLPKRELKTLPNCLR